MIDFIKEKTVCFSGHRNLPREFDLEKLNSTIKKYIDLGFNTFLVGMALGFDTLVAIELIKLKKIYPIKIVACIPCPDQDKKFTDGQKETYLYILDRVDEEILVSEHYSRYCMQKRNVFMVDNSSVLIAYLIEDKGGTKNTVEYAKRQNKLIEIL